MIASQVTEVLGMGDVVKGVLYSHENDVVTFEEQGMPRQKQPFGFVNDPAPIA